MIRLLRRRGKRPPAFRVPDLPCPACGQHLIIGYYFVDQHGRHQHTYYVCTFWPNVPNPDVLTKCGWHGWTVPGWDRGES